MGAETGMAGRHGEGRSQHGLQGPPGGACLSSSPLDSSGPVRLCPHPRTAIQMLPTPGDPPSSGHFHMLSFISAVFTPHC